jgi:glycine oxidase
VLVGASVESAGFDTRVDAETLERLRGLASGLVEALGSEKEVPQVEAWAGLRPATPDLLPVLGACERERHFIAGGHYRNGILLAPGTARVMADLLEGKSPMLDISSFSCRRFQG